ncbi:MAG: NUDIX hydrolase [Alphaproteobacteria bacterium]|nr:NUDIX hydrolase [Alphaproteobacteria bacterium]
MIKEVSYASYIIPVRIHNGKKQVAIMQYAPGAYGNIGGRFEDGETIAREALRRELIEELDESAWFMADIAIEIPVPYRYKVKEHNVPIRKAYNEVHIFFVAEIPDYIKLCFCEKCSGDVKVIWVDSESLVDENIIIYPDQREYFEKHVMPLIRKI